MTTSDHDDGYADAVRRLLRILRTQLGMQVAWVSEFVGTRQVFRYVDAEPGATAPLAGSSLPLDASFCARVLDGRLPAAIPDTGTEPSAVLLEATAQLRIGSYLGVPLRDADGLTVGMLCATSASPAPSVTARDVEAMRLMAELMRGLQVRALTEDDLRDRRGDVEAQIARVLAGEGRYPVLQPVVEIATGTVVVAEGLSRFTVDGRTPAQGFDEAARVGSREALELAAAHDVLDLLDGPLVPHDVGVAVNLGPTVLLGPGVADLEAGCQVVAEGVEAHEERTALHRLGVHDAQGFLLAEPSAAPGWSGFAVAAAG